MKIWGKFFGFAIGFMFGRIIGGLIGLWLGHLYDKKRGEVEKLMGKGSDRQALFFNTAFAVMGHVAKASGQVTEHDIRLATALMDQMRLSGDARREAQAAFTQGKAADFDQIGRAHV